MYVKEHVQCMLKNITWAVTVIEMLLILSINQLKQMTVYLLQFYGKGKNRYIENKIGHKDEL